MFDGVGHYVAIEGVAMEDVAMEAPEALAAAMLAFLGEVDNT